MAMTAHYPGPLDAGMQLDGRATRTAGHAGAALDLGDGRDFSRKNGVGMPVAAVVAVEDAYAGGGGESYTFTLQESGDGSAWSDIGLPAAADGPGTVLAAGFQKLRYSRLVLAVGGTAPSVTYAASLVPLT